MGTPKGSISLSDLGGTFTLDGSDEFDFDPGKGSVDINLPLFATLSGHDFAASDIPRVKVVGDLFPENPEDAIVLIPENMEVPDGSMVLGSPGKVKRELSEAQKKMLEASAAHYVRNGQYYTRHLKAVE